MGEKATFPLMTLLLTAAVALLFLVTRSDAHLSALLYSRVALDEGELWRLLTGHLVHFSRAHLAADLGGFLLLGVLIEREQGAAVLLGLLVRLALGTSIALWLCVPTMSFYGGISALNYGMLTWLCLTQRSVVQKRWKWVLSLFPVIIMAHVGWQYTSETTLLSAGLPRFVRVAWQAHLAAVLLAFACAGAKEGVRAWRKPALSPAATR